MKATVIKSKSFFLCLTATTFVFLTKLSIFTSSPVQPSTGSVTTNSELTSVTFDPGKIKGGDEESNPRKRVSGNPLRYTGRPQTQKVLSQRNATQRLDMRRFSTPATKERTIEKEHKKKKGAKGKKKTQEERKAKRRLSTLTLSNGAALRNIDFTNYSPEDRAILEDRVGVLTDRARTVARGVPGDATLMGAPREGISSGISSISPALCGVRSTRVAPHRL
nr:uncharacterized protein LOC113823421 [Penaeus vannamei]